MGSGFRIKDLGFGGFRVQSWEFPKIRVPYFGGPYYKDPTI